MPHCRSKSRAEDCHHQTDNPHRPCRRTAFADISVARTIFDDTISICDSLLRAPYEKQCCRNWNTTATKRSKQNVEQVDERGTTVPYPPCSSVDHEADVVKQNVVMQHPLSCCSKYSCCKMQTDPIMEDRATPQNAKQVPMYNRSFA